MTFTEPATYKYAMNVKLNQVQGVTAVGMIFPHIEDLMISSRTFDKFEEAVDSTNLLVAELTKSLNAAVNVEQYNVLSELNPKLTGKETLSKDWGSNEMAKVWIVDQIAQKTTPGPLRAVAIAQLLEIPGPAVLVS
jgi:hypothetical protein